LQLATAAQTKPGHFRAAIGSPSINQLLRIEEELGDKAVYGARIRYGIRLIDFRAPRSHRLAALNERWVLLVWRQLVIVSLFVPPYKNNAKPCGDRQPPTAGKRATKSARTSDPQINLPRLTQPIWKRLRAIVSI
jgi:hypothetical protein